MEELIKEIRKLLEVKEKELIDFQSGIKRVSDIDIHNMDRLEELIKILEVNMTDRERIIEKLKEFEVLAYLKENSEMATLSRKFSLTDEQLKKYEATLALFNKCRDLLLQKKIDDSKILDEDIAKINEVLNRLSEETEFYRDVAGFMRVMKEMDLSLEKQYHNLLELLKRNNNIYQEKIQNINKEVKKEEISLDSLGKLFKRYGYNFEVIDDGIKKELLLNGNYRVIEEMLKRIKNYAFISVNSLIFRNLMLYSSVNIFDKIEEIARKYGISLRDLCDKYPGIFISTNSLVGGMKVGSYEDFIELIPMLIDKGLDIKRIISYMGAEIIDKKNRGLVFGNIELAKLYGFTPNGFRDNIYPFAKGALNSRNTFNSVDKFIELSSDGVRYAETAFSKMALNVDEMIIRIKILTEEDFTDVYFICEGLSYINSKKITADKFFTDYAAYMKSDYVNKIKEVPDGRVSEYRKGLVNIDDKLIIGANQFNEIVRNSLNNQIDMKYITSNNELMKIISDGKVSYIGGKRISNLKVLRIFTTLCRNGYNDENALLYAVTYGSLLKYEEFLRIKKEISSLFEKRGTR